MKYPNDAGNYVMTHTSRRDCAVD